MKRQIVRLFEYLEALPIKTMMFDGMEADDLVSAYHNKNTVICSPDKDVLQQNIGQHYNYGKAELISVDKFEAQRFLWKQVLMGDSTDGIEGIPKVGPKTADTWLKDLLPDEMPEFVLNKSVSYTHLTLPTKRIV